MKHSPLYWPIFTFSSFYFYFKQITVSQIFCIYHALFISFARLSARSLISLSLQQSPKVICDKGFVKFLSFLIFFFPLWGFWNWILGMLVYCFIFWVRIWKWVVEILILLGLSRSGYQRLGFFGGYSFVTLTIWG